MSHRQIVSVAPPLTYGDPPDNSGNKGGDILYLPAPDAKRFENKMENNAEAYQLQLRVSDGLFRYMKALEATIEAKTASSLVRSALQALEAALDQYSEIHRCDGLVISADGVAPYEPDDLGQITLMEGKKVHRINVVLRGAEHARLQRLQERLDGLSLVDVVSTALGVLDAMVLERQPTAFSPRIDNSVSDTASGRDEELLTG